MDGGERDCQRRCRVSYEKRIRISYGTRHRESRREHPCAEQTPNSMAAFSNPRPARAAVSFRNLGPAAGFRGDGGRRLEVACVQEKPAGVPGTVSMYVE